MNAKMVTVGIGLLLVVAVGFAAVLFWIQNSSREVMLSLNLGFLELSLQEPVAVPVLIVSSAGGGALIGLVCGFLMRGSGRRTPPTYGSYDTTRYGEASTDRV